MDLHGQQLGLLIGHSLDFKTRAQLLHRVAEPVEVDAIVAHDAVGVIGQSLGAGADSGRAPTITSSTPWRSSAATRRATSSSGEGGSSAADGVLTAAALSLKLGEELQDLLP